MKMCKTSPSTLEMLSVGDLRRNSTENDSAGFYAIPNRDKDPDAFKYADGRDSFADRHSCDWPTINDPQAGCVLSAKNGLESLTPAGPFEFDFALIGVRLPALPSSRRKPPAFIVARAILLPYAVRELNMKQKHKVEPNQYKTVKDPYYEIKIPAKR